MALCGAMLCAPIVVSCGARTELETFQGNIGSTSLFDAGVDAPVTVDGGMVGLPPIDPGCTMGESADTVYPPYVPLVPPDEPANCANGFEIGDATAGSVYTLTSNQPGGAAAIT